MLTFRPSLWDWVIRAPVLFGLLVVSGARSLPDLLAAAAGLVLMAVVAVHVLGRWQSVVVTAEGIHVRIFFVARHYPVEEIDEVFRGDKGHDWVRVRLTSGRTPRLLTVPDDQVAAVNELLGKGASGGPGAQVGGAAPGDGGQEA
ncbi:hypothetical protein GCM10022223_62140 [Kineosporia mesophila]|uniref:PH (Pleckstrin Homology) domain-containing protein n=1 Tax=Kineosporia mesophila TaxID=566012 RepID=A0ABP7ALT3_9ACTN|nr:hypothetical protein [Kineosporia mesophila]MCD5353977.1 hypothetical protein [Kineosporia mesophila]